MADTATTTPAPPKETPAVVPEKEGQKATESPAKETPAHTEATSTSHNNENPHKRNHPEYDDKSKEELVDVEKKKIQRIHQLVNEVQHDSERIDAKIAEARKSESVDERNAIITTIKSASEEMKEKVHTAAVLEGEVEEINEVLKEKKKVEHDKEEAGETTTTTTTTTTNKEGAKEAVPTK